MMHVLTVSPLVHVLGIIALHTGQSFPLMPCHMLAVKRKRQTTPSRSTLREDG